MKSTLVKLVGRPLRAGVRWYLSKTRSYTYDDISIDVMPEVFHPGLFFSTKFILTFLKTQDLKEKKFLELGCGSGLISIYASKNKAEVTASDINPVAIQNAKTNAIKNLVDVSVIHSDLFDNLNKTIFDWVVVNPPYYPADPKRPAEYAWYCGKNHAYFERFFSEVKNYTNSGSKILMVLSDVCDLQAIFSIGEKHGVKFEKITEKDVWTDGKNYLYWVKTSAMA
jgi:release factor glutamine methyltransferase